jgi:hypothetical protein
MKLSGVFAARAQVIPVTDIQRAHLKEKEDAAAAAWAERDRQEAMAYG